MSFLRGIFLLLICVECFFHPSAMAYSLSRSKIDFPRLCVHRADPSQYYPCVLNYIGLNSWSLYRCPNLSTFDEQSQQCLVKIPIDDSFEQLASYSSTASIQFIRLASFIVATPLPNEDPGIQHERRLVSLPPIAEKLIDGIPKKKRLSNRVKRQAIEPSSGVIWSNGYPLMRLDSAPMMEQNSAINGRSTHDSGTNHHALLVSEDELKYKKICYFTNWAQYRLSPAKFEPEDIDPFLCTHIVYAFAYIDKETFLISKVEANDEDLYRRINALKRLNPALKTLLGVGGWNMKSYAFSAMIHTDETRRNFVFDSIKHHFDGLEIDWEYPGLRGGQADDKHYLTLLLQEFKQATTAQAIITGQPRLLIAAAVAADPDIASNAYEIEAISKVLDYINIMTYDFHGAWQNSTGLNAPLYRRYDELDRDGMLNQDFGIAIWLKYGAPAHKLVLGVPLFARSFLLAHADQNDLHAPTVGNGTEGPFTRSAGFLSYFEVCLLQSDRRWQKRIVPDGSESEYMFKDRDWISYDTIENVRKRAAYVVANHLGGMFVWSLDMDDFNGVFCHNGSYPYIKQSLALLPDHMPSYL